MVYKFYEKCNDSVAYLHVPDDTEFYVLERNSDEYNCFISIIPFEKQTYYKHSYNGNIKVYDIGDNRMLLYLYKLKPIQQLKYTLKKPVFESFYIELGSQGDAREAYKTLDFKGNGFDVIKVIIKDRFNGENKCSISKEFIPLDKLFINQEVFEYNSHLLSTKFIGKDNFDNHFTYASKTILNSLDVDV